MIDGCRPRGLPHPSIHLRERIGRLFVDEFQDSSPLQLAIFTAMAPLVDKSTWVGDPKQAIYGFRNADSVLTQAAFAGVAAGSTTPQDRLSRSYRSREAIVNLVNAAFSPALAAMGLDPQEHAFSGTARSEDGVNQGPLGVWWLDGKLELQFAVADVLVACDRLWAETAKRWPARNVAPRGLGVSAGRRSIGQRPDRSPDRA